MSSPVQTPPPPYFAVIFTSVRTDGDNDYGETAKQMLELASEQPGFLGFESARQEIGISATDGKTGSMKPIRWKTKSRGNLTIRSLMTFCWHAYCIGFVHLENGGMP